MLISLRALILGLAAIVLAACETGEHRADIAAVAEATFIQIQPTSIREGREYCGSIVRRSSGQLYATVPIPGGEASCPAKPFFIFDTFQLGDQLVANYHTHADFSVFGFTEVPSLQDMRVTAGFNVPSYVATPGGRFWFIRADGSLAYQICSIGCLPRDPNFFERGERFDVPRRVTPEDLRRMFL